MTKIISDLDADCTLAVVHDLLAASLSIINRLEKAGHPVTFWLEGPPQQRMIGKLVFTRPDARAAGVAVLTSGDTAIIEIRTGPAPETCQDVDLGIVLCRSEARYSEGGKLKKNIPVIATGIAGHFRVKDAYGTCHMQGTVGDKFDHPYPDMVLETKFLTATWMSVDVTFSFNVRDR